MIEYKGYRAVITFDYDDKLFHGEVVDTRDVIFFEGTTVEQIKDEFRFSIYDYLAACIERNRKLVGGPP